MREPFRFKQFSVADDRCTMKVGTDAVLLATWVELREAKMILDIGSGSGVIGLILAQRSQPTAAIQSVEISASDVLQSQENIQASPWPGKIRVHYSSIQAFEPVERFDLIVTNPPFFNNSLLPPSVERTVARHTNSLGHGELLSSIARLLAPKGRFALVLPTKEGNEFRTQASSWGYHCTRSLAFFTREGKQQERWLFEFSNSSEQCREENLVLYKMNNEWSDAYRQLTSGFYLDTDEVRATM